MLILIISSILRKPRRHCVIHLKELSMTSGETVEFLWDTNNGWEWRNTFNSLCIGPNQILRSVCWRMSQAARLVLPAWAQLMQQLGEPQREELPCGDAGVVVTRNHHLKSFPNSEIMKSNFIVITIFLFEMRD